MILVVGMARSGVAAARLLKSRGRDVFVTDSGKPEGASELRAAGIRVETGGHTADLFLTAEEIVLSPGVPPDIPPIQAARAKGVPVVSELEVASRYLRGSIIAITGSNGKTTTTTLVGEILKAAGRTVQVGGNIGAAMCGLVETSTPATINVIEVSSFQLEGIRNFHPNAAAVLNVTPDHLDRYAGFDEYRRTKFRIFESQREGDVAILNKDDPQVVPSPVPIRSQIRYFSRLEKLTAGASRVGPSLCLNGEPVLPVSDMRLRGDHNIENVLAAMTLVDGYGITSASLARTIREFRGVEHRLEFVRSLEGVEYFNDSKATNVDSSLKAVNSFERNVIIILGGRDKGAPYEPLVSAMRGRVKHVLLLGEAAGRIGLAIGSAIPSSRVTSLETAVRDAARIATPGDVVLLSPACASYDMFVNYEHRGRVFKQAVLELPL
jgi:UDP-N-acetylmuramoylalanine--D-glutamate ligase